MAKKFSKDNPPITLDETLFFGINVDDSQKDFRDSIWDDKINVVFCDSVAGSGKTTISTAAAIMLKNYKNYDGILYIVSPYGEFKQGYLPGTIVQKSEVYFEPFYQALMACGLNPFLVIDNEPQVSDKNKTNDSYIRCFTHTFTRGTNFDKKVVIIDEAQNYTTSELKKILTRCHDNCKVIVIGHSGQIDLPNPNRSGFAKYIKHFSTEEYSKNCSLTINYRGRVSRHADTLKENNNE